MKPKHTPKNISYGRPCERSAHFDAGVRYVENISRGLRVDKVHELPARHGEYGECPPVKHHGWYLDDDFQQETVCGLVVRLPHGVCVPGITDPWNDDAASVDFSSQTDNPRDCAGWADSMAERYADAEREYQSAWRAGRDVEEKWSEAQSLVEEIAGLCPDSPTYARTLARLESRLEELADEIETIHDENSDCAGYCE